MKKIKITKISKEDSEKLAKQYEEESFGDINANVVEITINDDQSKLLSNIDNTLNFIKLIVKIENKNTKEWVMWSERYDKTYRSKKTEDKKGGDNV
jgi:hypothetical protein